MREAKVPELFDKRSRVHPQGFVRKRANLVKGAKREE
jgi:hypothetical protein